MSQRQVRSLVLRGRRWKVSDQSSLPIGDLGQCDYEHRVLYGPFEGDSREDLDVILHEILHGCVPDLDEQAVDETATSMANALYRLGWRNEY